MSDEIKPGTFNANSVIMGMCTFIVLGVLGWIGAKTADNANALTRLEATLPYINQSIAELKAQLANLVTRSELDSRVSELKARDSELEKRILILEVGAKQPAQNP